MKINMDDRRDTEKRAYELGKCLKAGDTIALVGDLGAGKTTFTQSLARGLGIEDVVTSPTFAILNIYRGRISLYHFDFYRLESEDDFYEMGGEDFFNEEGVTVVEWADLIFGVMPENLLLLDFTKLEGESRAIEVSAFGPRGEELLEEWLA